jgi:hypothetical protein
MKSFGGETFLDNAYKDGSWGQRLQRFERTGNDSELCPMAHFAITDKHSGFVMELVKSVRKQASTAQYF